MTLPPAVSSLQLSPRNFKRPSQGLLFPSHEPSRPRAAAVNRYTAANREAARIILQEPERYAGLPLRWAELILARPEGRL